MDILADKAVSVDSRARKFIEAVRRTPRCRARSRRTGLPCLMAGLRRSDGTYTRCQYHGGYSTGPKPATLALRAIRMTTHGRQTKQAYAARKEARAVNRALRLVARELRGLAGTPFAAVNQTPTSE